MAAPISLFRPVAGERIDPQSIDATGATLGHVLTAVSDGSGGQRAGYAAPGGSSYTDENAQDAVGGILDDGGDIDFTYDDATPKITALVKARAVTWAKVQAMTSGKLLGRSTASSGDIEEITPGSGLTLSGGVLSATGGGSATLAPAGPKTAIVTADWSTRNAGSTTYTTSSRDSSVNIRVPASASNAFRGQDKAAPSTPYTCIATITSPLIALDNMGYGVYFYNVAAAKAIAIQIVIVGGSLQIYIQLSDTSFGMTGTVYKNSTLVDEPLLLALRDDGTNKSYWIGGDEEHMTAFYSHGRTVDITPDRVGFFGNPRQGSYDQVVTCFSWKEQSGSPA